MALCKSVNSLARKVVHCPYCSATNGVVKKAGALKIIHDKFRAKKTAEEMETWKKTFTAAVKAQKELGGFLNKALFEDLNPLKVLDLFKRVTDEVGYLSFPGISSQIPNPNRSCRIANFWDSGQRQDGQKSTFGNTYPFLLSASGHP